MTEPDLRAVTEEVNAAKHESDMYLLIYFYPDAFVRKKLKNKLY